MSRRGGKRRQVLQLGESSSKLHLYGYAKGFHSKQSSGQGFPSTLVGDYSDSESDENDNEAVVEAINGGGEEQNDLMTSAAEKDPSSPVPVNDKTEDASSAMDDELRNFLSEIEAIPMPEETSTETSNSNAASPAPNQTVEEVQGSSADTSSAMVTTEVSNPKKKSSAYSMFVKGEVEFAHSPVQAEANESHQDKPKENGDTDPIPVEIPEEPTTLWQMVQDEATQYYYYWNWQTNEVTWEIPSGYTQYLLLHREYEEKIAKLDPKTQQAIKDKAACKAKENKKNSNGKVKDVFSTDTTTLDDSQAKARLIDSDPILERGVRLEEDDRLHSSHHSSKRKKAKKHKTKRRHSDDDAVSGDEEVSSITSKSSASSKKSTVNKMIGPQALSIVPYMSDNDEEDEDDERSVCGSHLEKALSPEHKKVKISPTPDCQLELESLPSPHESIKSDHESASMQDLVKYEDSSSDPVISEALSDVQGPIPRVKEKDDTSEQTEADEHKTEVDSPHVPDLTEIKAEDEKSNEMPSITEEIISTQAKSESNDGLPVGVMQRDEKIDLLSLVFEKKKKKKKEEIDMFKDDSASSQSDQEEDEKKTPVNLESETVAATSTMEIEEGEICDGSELLKQLKPIDTAKYTQYEEKKLSKPTDHSQPQVGSFQGIVGYSEEEEEEEGELKEESCLVQGKEESKAIQSRGHRKMDVSKEDMIYHKDKNIKEGRAGSPDRECNTSPSTKYEVDSVSRDQEKPPSTCNDEDKVEEDSDDIDYGDIDDIDKVLEMALERKRDQKTDNKGNVEKNKKEAEILKLSHAEGSNVSDPVKLESEKMAKEEPSIVATDSEQLKSTVKEMVELALSKLQFLDISTKNLSKLQVLLIELQTRYSDWQSGGLSTSYFHQRLETSEALLFQYEESAVPSGWKCQWDRTKGRYFYRNLRSNHTQWEYPDIEVETRRKAEEKESRHKKRSKEKEREERDESNKGRGNSSSRSSRHRSSGSKKGQDKDKSKRDKHSSNSTHSHRKKKRRRRDHSSSSSSSEEENSHSRRRHNKRKKRGRSDKSPSVEIVDVDAPEFVIQVKDDGPSSHQPSPEVKALSTPMEEATPMDGGDEYRTTNNHPSSPPLTPTSSSQLVADYGSEVDMDKQEEANCVLDEKDQGSNPDEEDPSVPVSAEVTRSGDGNTPVDENEVVDNCEEMEGMIQDETEQEEESSNSAVIIKPPQINLPSYVAAANQPQLYSAPSYYASGSTMSSVVAPPAVAAVATAVVGGDGGIRQDGEGETNTSTAVMEEVDKASKKKKKDKSGKEKSLTASSSIMMKKKRVSSMVQKWQQVKKEVEKEDRAKELRQAAIREKINQLKST